MNSLLITGICVIVSVLMIDGLTLCVHSPKGLLKMNKLIGLNVNHFYPNYIRMKGDIGFSWIHKLNSILFPYYINDGGSYYFVLRWTKESRYCKELFKVDDRIKDRVNRNSINRRLNDERLLRNQGNKKKKSEKKIKNYLTK